jgi:hypothetical protein
VEAVVSDLVFRLSETLDELERMAREASLPMNTGEWWVEHPTAQWAEYKPDAIVCVDGKVATMEIETALASDHIVRWDPQAVLQLVGAVRKIIQLHNLARELRPELPPSPTLAVIAEGFGITEEAP